MKKPRKILEKSSLKKPSNKNLMRILLHTKKFLQNNNNFAKKTIETEESDMNLAKKNSNNELPLVPASKIMTPLDNYKSINFVNPNRLSKKCLNSLLFSSMSFDNFLKEVVDSRVFGNSKDILPPILLEEKKGNDSTSNINNNSEIPVKNVSINKPQNFNNNKKYLFCLETLEELKLNHRHNMFNQFNLYNEINKEGKYNISRNVLFRDIILNESSYHDLYYNNDKYLMDIKYYNDFIKSQIKKLRREIPPEEDFRRTLEKEYKYSEYSKPILTLNSLSVSFTCKGKYHLFHIPFELLPIFYYQNMTNLKYLLISIIRFNNDYEDISLDFEELTHVLSNSKQFELEDSTDKNSRSNKKYLSRESLLKSTKLVVRNNMHNFTNKFEKSLSRDLSIKKPSKLNQSIKRNKTIRILNGVKTTPHIEKKANEEEVEEKIYKCSYNKFMFKWNTPKYEYDVEIKVPEAILQIGRISLRAYIDIEYIFNFVENDYENWDYYTSQIIFSYKECTHHLNEIISLKNTNKFTLKRSSSQPLLKSLNTREIKQGNNKANRNIFLNMEKIQKISEKSKIYEFFYTDKNNSNYIKIFHNFSVSARCKSSKTQNKFAFDFNFFQMKILNQILKIQGLNHFIKKLIYIDKFTSNLRFGYDELNTMATGDYKYLANFNPNKDASQTCLRMKEFSLDIINITITFPFLETIRYDNQNYEDCFISDYNNVVFAGIPLEVLDKLCQKNFQEWSKLLIDMQS